MKLPSASSLIGFASARERPGDRHRAEDRRADQHEDGDTAEDQGEALGACHFLLGKRLRFARRFCGDFVTLVRQRFDLGRRRRRAIAQRDKLVVQALTRAASSARPWSCERCRRGWR